MKGAIWFLAAVLVGLVVFEISMQPTAEDRVLLGLIFLLVALLAYPLVLYLPTHAFLSWWTKRGRGQLGSRY